MKPPDRFARAAKKEMDLYHSVNPIRALLEASCARLLRAEHRAVVRKVKRMPAYMRGPQAMWLRQDGEWISKADLLVWLQRRGR